MDEYLKNISDTELVFMTRDFLIQQSVINTPVSQRSGKTYYFNENEVYSLDKEARLSSMRGAQNLTSLKLGAKPVSI